MHGDFVILKELYRLLKGYNLYQEQLLTLGIEFQY